MREEKPKRPAPIPYRPPAEKREAFLAMVKSSGLSTNAFLNECVFGRTRHRPAERSMLGQLLGQAGQISDQLRKHECHCDGGCRSEINEALSALLMIRNALMQLLGRRS